MLSVIVLSVVTLNAIMLSVVILSAQLGFALTANIRLAKDDNNLLH